MARELVSTSDSYGAVEALTDGFTKIYPANIIVPGAGQVGTPNLSVQTLLCDLYQGLNSIIPFYVGGEFESVSKLVTFATNKLAPVLGKGTALGCPDSTISPNKYLFPDSKTQKGGPKNPPPASDSKTGNNVYNNVYFAEAPKQPAC